MKNAKMFGMVLANWQWALIVGALTLPVVTLGGTESSGGLDNVDWSEGHAWFTKKSGRSEIQACVEVSHDFGASLDEVVSAAIEAAHTWNRYARDKKLIDNVMPLMNMRVARTCRGGEDLQFYFGVENQRVREARERFRSPFAMAVPESYDIARAWGSGFIWITTDKTKQAYAGMWKDRANLVGVLLHELGHAYGNDHLIGTIMDPAILNLILHSDPDPSAMRVKQRLRGIDHERELTQCWNCNEGVTWKASRDSEQYKPALEAGMKLLLGREAKGRVSAEVTFGSPAPLSPTSLIYRDSAGEYRVPLITKGYGPGMPYAGAAFKIIYACDDGSDVPPPAPGTPLTDPVPAPCSTGGAARGSQGQVLMGQVHIGGGVATFVALEGGSQAGMSIVVTDPVTGQPVTVFQADRDGIDIGWGSGIPAQNP